MLFDYQCECGHKEIDVLVRASDAVVLCSKCGKEMNKMMPSVSFKFTPHGMSSYKKKYGNNLPPNYKPTGGANFVPTPK